MAASTETPPAGWFFADRGSYICGAIISCLGGGTLFCEVRTPRSKYHRIFDASETEGWKFFEEYERLEEELEGWQP